MAGLWQGLMYVDASGILLLGAVTRDTGVGPWQAWRLHPHADNELIGEYPTAEDAQRAVERACEPKA